jgi:LysM repeat protein
MTERGLPIVDGAPACPFVAFEDDRDERATSPDHRHRCFAETPPAPRALAHQEAYCLSSAFPVCPTFQDWARREAARARDLDIPPEDTIDDDLPPLVDDRPPRRTTPGTWAAPPPWLRGGSPSGTAPGGAVGATGADAAAAAASGTAAAAGGSTGPGPEAAGLSGGFADRLTASGGASAGGWPEQQPGSGGNVGDLSTEGPGAAMPARARGPVHERLDRDYDGGDDDRDRDRDAPAWERPRRLEAYPAIRSRGLSGAGLPPLLLALVAVVLAAIALFFLPSLLGIGNPPPGPGASPTVGASVAPSALTEPTLEPVATPVTYVVQQGDTLSKIAKKFGVPLAALIDANKDTHPNPDILKVGDVLIIPSAIPTELPGASTSP